MKRKLVFYGDSNTYGFDPRDFFGGSYDQELIWTQKVAEHFREQWMVFNEGMNGRELPADQWDYKYIKTLMEKLGKEDLFAIMLGTNDLLSSLEPDAGIPVRRMEQLLIWLKDVKNHPDILVIAPPYIGSIPQDLLFEAYRTAGIRMNEGFCELAGKYQTWFLDAGAWDVELSYDRVHFSEKGHASFAENMISFLETL